MLTVVLPNYRIFISDNVPQVFQARIESIGAAGMLWAVPTRRGRKTPQGWIADRERMKFDASYAVGHGNGMSHLMIPLTNCVMLKRGLREMYTLGAAWCS